MTQPATNSIGSAIVMLVCGVALLVLTGVQVAGAATSDDVRGAYVLGLVIQASIAVVLVVVGAVHARRRRGAIRSR